MYRSNDLKSSLAIRTLQERESRAGSKSRISIGVELSEIFNIPKYGLAVQLPVFAF